MTFGRFMVMAMMVPAVAGAAPSPYRAPKGPEASYLYDLAASTGVIRESFGDISFDRTANELFVVNDNTVRVFNQSGMETFRFQGDDRTGNISSVVALPEGDLVVLGDTGRESVLSRCDYRGEFIEYVKVKGLPASLESGFRPTALGFANGNIYLADRNSLFVVVMDVTGAVTATYDLGKLAQIDDDKRDDAGIRGFSVDAEGAMLFTIPTQFRAYVVAPDGTVRDFGQKGSTPGKFNIVAGIDRDERGNIYVTDMLRSVVMVFDSSFEFLREIGSRGRGPDQFIVPHEIVAANGRLFVSQYGKRGVSVYKVAAN